MEMHLRNEYLKAIYNKRKVTLSQLSIPHAKQDVSNKKIYTNIVIVPRIVLLYTLV